MPPKPAAWVAAVLLGISGLACGSSETTPLDPTSLASRPHTISGRLQGPDGNNICRTVGSGTMLVRLINPDFDVAAGNAPFLGLQDITCPRNRYSFTVDPGTAHIRVQLPVTEGLGALPWRTLDQVPVGEEGLEHDVSLAEGTGLGGLATLNGSPFENAGLNVLYDFNPNFASGFAVSGPDGAWMDFFGRSPFILQNGVGFQAVCVPVLGTRLSSGPPSGGFLFPGEASAVDCTMEDAPAVAFSHTFTRMVVTPMPGDIGGGISSEFFDQYGVGWGAQFPVASGESPSHDPAVSQIFNGGLLIGVSPNSILSGVDPGGEMECGATCRDLGVNGTVKFSTRNDGRKTVTWRYSTTASAEVNGLEVTQVSVDGKPPHDYVLFRFTIRNIRPTPITLYAGHFGDWDIEFDPGDDLGFTELDGKLMYQVSQFEAGIHAGTMILGAPASGNYFFTGADFPSIGDQFQALSGGLTQQSAGPADLRYIQGVGPITLKKGQQRDVWIAVVAGEGLDQLLANAAAAQAEVKGGLGQSLTSGSITSTVPATGATRAPARAAARSGCKDCRPQ